MISANQPASPNWAETMTTMLQGFGRLTFPFTGAAIPTAGANPFLEFFMAGQRAFGESLAAATQTGKGAEMLADYQHMAATFLNPFAILGRVEAGAKNPLLDAMEHTYGAVSDALGFGAPRDFQKSMRAIIAAGIDRERAQVDLLARLNTAWPRIGEGVGKRLAELATQGKSPARLIELLRIWTEVSERVFHEILQSPEGLAAIAGYLRATTRYRIEVNRIIELVSEFYNIPTRAEVDEAYREIQSLKREVRALRRATPSASIEATGGSVAPKETA
jgi:Poly(R)-hydroxyalkanoic acid synthase subunit (PHA_synth_III_E)